MSRSFAWELSPIFGDGTWEHKASKLQFNGAAGVSFNFDNTETNYQTGNEFRFDWAIGREVATGLVLGIVGYDYRQLTGDSGPGATLGPLKGRVDAIGPGLSYTTIVHKHPLILNLRHYQEFNAENCWEGNSTFEGRANSAPTSQSSKFGFPRRQKKSIINRTRSAVLATIGRSRGA